MSIRENWKLDSLCLRLGGQTLPRDKSAQARRCNARRLAKLNDFNLVRRNQLIQLGATYADHARSIVYPYANRIGRRRRNHSGAPSSRKPTGSAIQRLTADSRQPAP